MDWEKILFGAGVIVSVIFLTYLITGCICKLITKIKE